MQSFSFRGDAPGKEKLYFVGNNFDNYERILNQIDDVSRNSQVKQRGAFSFTDMPDLSLELAYR